MSRPLHDRLRAFASHLEEATPPDLAERIAGRAILRAEEVPAGRLRSLAARLQAAPAVAERIAARAVAAGSQCGRRYVLRRIGAIAAAAATLSIGAIGVGAIANQAAPGDLLYGVDRAYEAAGHAFGSRAPHTEERLTEALALIDKGRSAEAVALIDEAVKDYSVQNGLTDLEKTYAAARGTSAAVTTTTTTAPAPPETAAVTPSAPAAPPTTIVAAAEPDPVTTLRLAVEMLLSHVQTHETDGRIAETVALAGSAVAAVEAPPTVVAAPATTATTPAEEVAAPSTESATTTVAPNTITLPPPTDVTVTTSDETTLTLPTTTIPSESTTTTTTTDESSTTTTTTQADDGSGGIILPPQP